MSILEVAFVALEQTATESRNQTTVHIKAAKAARQDLRAERGACYCGYGSASPCTLPQCGRRAGSCRCRCRCRCRTDRRTAPAPGW